MTATFDAVARRQLGLVTHRQLTEECRWTTRQIERAVAKRNLVVVRRGVYRAEGAPVTREVVWLAAQLAAGGDHHLGDLTAAAVWGLKGFPDPTEIDLLTTSTSRARFEGVRTHRTISLPRGHVTTRGALSVTTVERTLVDTCAAVAFPVLKSAANDALRRRIMRTADFVRTFEQTPRSGRRASRPARLLVAEFVPGYDPGDSDAELDIVDVLVRAGYPRPAQQIGVRGKGWKYRIDVGYRDVKHGFEFQSVQEHFNLESFHSDPLRTVRLQAAGWTMWPVTSRFARAEILLAASAIFGRPTSASGHETTA